MFLHHFENLFAVCQQTPNINWFKENKNYWLTGCSFTFGISEFRAQTLSSLFSVFICIGFASFTGSKWWQNGDASRSRSYILFGSSPWKQMPNFVLVFSAKSYWLLLLSQAYMTVLWVHYCVLRIWCTDWFWSPNLLLSWVRSLTWGL